MLEIVVTFYTSSYDVIALIGVKLGAVAVVNPCKYMVKLSRVTDESLSLTPNLYILPLLKSVLFLSIDSNDVLTLVAILKLVVFLELLSNLVIFLDIDL